MLCFIQANEQFGDLPSEAINALIAREVAVIHGAKAEGLIVGLYRATEEQRVVGIANVDERAALDAFSARLPMADYLRWEVVPVFEV